MLTSLIRLDKIREALKFYKEFIKNSEAEKASLLLFIYYVAYCQYRCQDYNDALQLINEVPASNQITPFLLLQAQIVTLLVVVLINLFFGHRTIV